MKYVSLLLAGGLLLASGQVNAQAKKKPAPRKTGTQTTARTTAGGGFVALKDGLEARKLAAGTGQINPKLGDQVMVHVKQRIDDSLLISSATANGGAPVPVLLQESPLKGDLMAGLLTMKKGDSTTFRIPLDTIIGRANAQAVAMGQQAQPRPEWAKKNAYVFWDVKLVDIKDKALVDAERQKQQDEFRKMQEQEAANVGVQARTDDSLIQVYLKQKGITNAQKTESGLYYVVQKAGTGEKAKAGQKVTVNYTGRNTKEETFDSNVDPAFNHVQPFEFNLGSHSVIPGWDEGVALMNKGMKATFYIPSGMAYGPRARAEKIPANAILIFDIELIDFQ